MKTIPQIFRKNGFAYSLVTRRGMVAIYEQRGAGGIAAYEVHHVRKVKPGQVRGKPIEGGETLASDRLWGKYGWTYSTYGGAVGSDAALAQAETKLGALCAELAAKQP